MTLIESREDLMIVFAYHRRVPPSPSMLLVERMGARVPIPIRTSGTKLRLRHPLTPCGTEETPVGVDR